MTSIIQRRGTIETLTFSLFLLSIFLGGYFRFIFFLVGFFFLLYVLYSLLHTTLFPNIERRVMLYLLALQILILVSLIGFYLFQYRLRLGIGWSILICVSILLIFSGVFRKRYTLEQTNGIKKSLRNSADLIFISILSFLIYFLLLIRYTYYSGPLFFAFGDNASYLSNIWSYYHGTGMNLGYAGGSLFTSSSFYVYFSSSYSFASWIFYFLNGSFNPLLFFVVTTALFNTILVVEVYAVYFKNMTPLLRILATSLVISGLSSIGLLYYYSNYLLGIPFLSSIFQGTPFPITNPNVYLKGISQDIVLKGIWHSLPYTFFISYLFFSKHVTNRYQKIVADIVLLSSLVSYLPLGMLFIAIVVIGKVATKAFTKHYKSSLVLCILIPYIIWLGLSISSPEINLFGILFTVNQSKVIFGNILSITIFLLPFLILFVITRLLGQSQRENYKENVQEFLFVPLITLIGASIVLFDIRFTVSGVSEVYALGFAISLLSLLMSIEFLNNISNHFNITRKFFQPSKRIVTSDKAMQRKILIVLMISFLIVPTMAYSVNGGYYGQQNSQSIYISSNQIAVANWIKTNDINQGYFMTPEKYWYIPATLAGVPSIVSPFIPFTNNRTDFVNTFFTSNTYNFTFWNSSMVDNWFQTSGVSTGSFHLDFNKTFNGHPTVAIHKEEYSSISKAIDLPLKGLTVTFAVFPENYTNTLPLGVSFNLSTGGWIAVNQFTVNTSDYLSTSYSFVPYKWNVVTVNLSSLASNSSWIDLDKSVLTQINLLGGDSPVTNFAFVKMSYSKPLSQSHLVDSLSKYHVDYIMAPTGVNNTYIFALLNKSILTMVYSNSGFIVYKVEGLNIKNY